MTTKRFARLQVIIILMLTFTLICNTFSWATRPEVKGGAFMGGTNTDGDTPFAMDKTYFTAIKLVTPERGYHINGSSCTAVTYRALIDDETGEVVYDKRGNIVYNETTPVTFETNSIETELNPHNALYFKTVITNPSDVTTNTSLFVNAKYHTNINTLVMIGITTPVTKASPLVTKDAADMITDMHTVKWYPILAGIEVGPNSTRNVEWCIYNSSDEKYGDFCLDNIYFTNN